MEYKSIKRDKILICIFLVMLIILIKLLIPGKVNAYSDESFRNSFYVKVINFSMPVMKSASQYETGENRKTFKEYMLQMIGLDMRDPFSIMEKEVSYFKTEVEIHTEVDKKRTAANDRSDELKNIDPFKLDDNHVFENDVDKTEDDNKNTIVSIYDPNLVNNNPSKVQVLIYHSHTSEGYKPGEKHNHDGKNNVCAAGDEIEHELKNYGVKVIHDKSIHDANYSDSYTKSGKTLDKYLEKYGDFDLIIDLHRDQVPNKKMVTTKINGESVARYMFVVATKNPHYQKNKAVIDKLLEISNKNFPGLSRGNGIYTYEVGMNYYNQTKSNNAFIIELGAQCSHIDEAKNTAKYLARIFAEYLSHIQKIN